MLHWVRAVPLACLVALAGCGDDRDKTAACDLASLGEATGSTTSAATVQDRRILGPAAPYAPDPGLAMRDAELRGSIAARRQAAWEVARRVLAPVPLAEPRLAERFGGEQPLIPAWHTWYARDDFERVFKKLYRDLGVEGRRMRSPIDPGAGLAWNATALDELPSWPEERYLDYLAEIDTLEEAHGVGNISRNGYSPGAMAHLLRSYVELHACRLEPPPDPYDDDPVREGLPVTAREQLEVAECGWQVLGPFQAGAADVVVTARGQGDADLYVRRGAPPEPAAFDCRSRGDGSDERCVVAGGGPVYVAVFGATAASVALEIAYLAEDVREPTCLDGEMPRDAVVVKAEWRRALDGEGLPVFDTSASAMAARLDDEPEWTADGEAEPSPSDIYTVTLPTGARFHLPALHIMTKELDHWMWITLWYSPTPDTDFGADRPPEIAALPGPWRNYKMCVVTQYVEEDPDPRGGFSGSLGEALAAVHRGGPGASTWCSNPYIEHGPGNAATNCIGCHQHGGTELTTERILSELPHFGTTRVRNNFFTDYSWAVKGALGDDLSALVQAEVDYWDASDPPSNP
jgi:hypothetical protein